MQWFSFDKFFYTLVVVPGVTILCTLLLLVLYVRKVEKLMGRGDGGTKDVPSGAGAEDAPSGVGAEDARVRALPLWRPVRPRPELRLEHYCDSTPLRVLRRGAPRLWPHARRARYSTAAIYTLVALAHVFTLLLVLSWVSYLPLSSSPMLIAGVVLLWPVGQAFFWHIGAGLAVRVSAAALYLLAVAALVSVEWPDAPGNIPGRFAGIVFFMVFVPPVVRALVMNEWLKAAGTTVLVFVTGVAVGVLLTAWLREKTGIGVPLTLLAGSLLVRATTAFACLNIWWMVRRHARKKASDRMAVNVIYWMMLSEWFTYVLASLYGPWALFALFSFASLMYVRWAGFQVRSLFMLDAPGDVRLLLLRTFTKRGRVERLLGDPARKDRGAVWAHNLLYLWRILGRDTLIHKLETRWRFVGSIQLIAGPDLATTYVDVDELVEWVTGQLRSRFIKTDKDLAGRKAIDAKPDPDGRYRVNEFFCGGEMWGKTLVELLKRDATHVVLMDLRGFAAANAGVVHELGQLVQHVPLRQVVLAVDHRTDFPLLDRKLKEFWQGVCECSPNYRERDPALRILHIRHNGRAAARLLALLLRAAEERAAAAAVAV